MPAVDDTYFAVTGKIVDDGTPPRPVPGVLVEARDVDPPNDPAGQLLGRFVTGADGAFEIGFTGHATRGPLTPNGELKPEVQLKVFVNNGQDAVNIDGSSPPVQVDGTPGTVRHDFGQVKVLFQKLEEFQQHHGLTMHRGMDVGCSRFAKEGRFGRLFYGLPSHQPADELLERLGLPGGPMDGGAAGGADSPTIPAGFTFFGQFIDHDITLDVTSSLERQNDPAAVENFRTPLLELDNVYRSGPDVDPYLYDFVNGRFTGKLVYGTPANPNDLQRAKNGRAIIGDPRNDENALISQLQLTFIKFHNAVVDATASPGLQGNSLFEEAQRIVRWTYQYIIVKEFLPLIVGQAMVDSILNDGCMCYEWDRPHPPIPVEFAVAAYRYGHSQVRQTYKVNDATAQPLDLFGSALGMGFQPIAPQHVVQWRHFFKVPGNAQVPQMGKKIDTVLAPGLLNLPFVADPRPARKSLASRNLVRAKSFSLPSGEAAARAMKLQPLAAAQNPIGDMGLRETPLWFYLLKEAAVTSGAGADHLGPVGGRIVAEVLLGLLLGDPMSYLVAEPSFIPTHAKSMGELVNFAGAA